MILENRFKNPLRTVCTVVCALTILFSGANGLSYTNQLSLPLSDPTPANTEENDRSTQPVPPRGNNLIIEPDATGTGAQQDETTTISNLRTRVPSLTEYAKGIPADLFEGTKRIISGDNVTLGLIGIGLTGLALTADHGVKGYFQERRPLGQSEKFGSSLGQWTLHAGIGAALFGAGELFGRKKLADTGIVALEALLMNGIVTEGLKLAVGRTRPNEADRMSFPAGRVSGTAALAASISEMNDWDLRLAIPLYLTAAFVGASQAQRNAHYFSDVVGGMAIGTLIGRSMAKSFKERHTFKSSTRKITISPILEKNMKGLVFNWNF